MAFTDQWLEGIDIDGALYDVRDDDSQTWEARAIAGASIGIDAIAGFRAVLELCEAMNRIVRGEDDGKRRLAEILGRESGQASADPVRLIVPMLERFIATDRGFVKARKSKASQ